MARPREFDAEQVMQDAMDAFWEHGYNATSVNDLLAEMKMNRGSLYGAFGDKKTLFLATLDKYDQQRSAEIHEILHRPGPVRSALREWFDQIADMCTGQAGMRGCMAIKSAMEMAPHDKEIADWVKKFHRRNHKMVAEVLRRGQAQGEISAGIDADIAARFLLASLSGLHMLGTTSPTRKEVRDVMDMILKALG